MRLRGKAKAGFYPTPPRVVEEILRLLDPVPPVAVLDPCAGEGDALLALKRGLKAQALGIELSRERAKKAVRKGLAVYQGDAFGFEGEGFGLLWLNPPYDHGEGERLELTFLRHWTPALKPGGVLVYIIPEGILDQVAPFVTSHFRVEGVYRFPEPEYQDFRQVVVLGVREEVPLLPSTLRVEGSLPAPLKLRVPPSEKAFLRRRENLDPEKVLKALERSPLFEEARARDFQPLLPLKNAHLALMLAGGLMDNGVVWLEGRPYLVRGQVRKVEHTAQERDGNRVRNITRERFQVQVVALGLLDGEILEVE